MYFLGEKDLEKKIWRKAPHIIEIQNREKRERVTPSNRVHQRVSFYSM